MKLAYLFLSALTVAATGCGKSTGPKASITGTWSLSATNLVGGALSCDVSGAVLDLTQSHSTFTGTYSNVILNCTANGTSLSEGPYSGPVVDGQISKSSVSFDLKNSMTQLTGTPSDDDSMAGTVVLTTDFGSPYGVVTLNGSWAAERSN